MTTKVVNTNIQIFYKIILHLLITKFKTCLRKNHAFKSKTANNAKYI